MRCVRYESQLATDAILDPPQPLTSLSFSFSFGGSPQSLADARMRKKAAAALATENLFSFFGTSVFKCRWSAADFLGPGKLLSFLR